MMTVIKAKDRGFADHGWLKSFYTFSFADYYDPSRMGFSVLRVINEDRIEGGKGFKTHPHRDMEIISYVIEGALDHKDSMGTKTVINPSEIQRMSAGTGIRHSEYNHFADKKTHFLQIWILPDKKGLTPGYEQRSFEKHFSNNDLILVGSKDEKEGSISISQDVNLYVCKSAEKGKKNFKMFSARNIWLQIIKGQVQADGVVLTAGDGAGLEKVESIDILWTEDSEFLLFDLP